MTCQSPLLALITGVLCVAPLIATGRKAIGLYVTAIFLTLAAADLFLGLPQPGPVAVLIDVSPSTRTAAYRDESYLRHRLGELLPGTNYAIYHFADALHKGLSTAELPTSKTRFPDLPPETAAVVLFSDGQFAPPRDSPPTYPILDPNLEHVEDACVTALTLADDNTHVIATASNSTSTPQSIQWSGIPESLADPLPPGTHVITHNLSAGALITARVTGEDPWPENNAITLRPPPPSIHELWWVGSTRPAPGGFRSMRPNDLPTDSAQYLQPAAVVLDNLAAADVPPDALPLLGQYVRDLGGSLVILGGDRAFADYLGTDLETLSPLASAPPRPQRRWVLLLDASGSMAQADKWPRALAAITHVLPSLPPNDLVSIGSFSNDVTWWAEGSAKDVPAASLPPTTVHPHGPTNLPTALAGMAKKGPATAMLITDAELTLPDLPAHIRTLMDHQVRLSALIISDTPPGALAALTSATQGRTLTDPDPAHWLPALKELTNKARPPTFDTTAVVVAFQPPAQALGMRNLPSHNVTYPKPDTTAVATSTTQPSPLAATWHLGIGQVMAASFSATPQEVTTLTQLFCRPPADPALTATWDLSHDLHVTVDTNPAAHAYSDGLHVTLVLNRESHEVAQTAPGQYSIILPYPPEGATAILQANGRTVSQTELPPRYPEEFASLGTNYPTLTALASQSHGQLIPPDRHAPIAFHWPTRPHSLTPYFAALATLTLLGHLVRHRTI